MAGGAGDAGSVGTTVWLGALVAKRAGGRMLEDKRPRESEKMLRRRQSADNGAGPWTHLCVTLIHITNQNWLGSPVSEGHFSGPPKASDCPYVPLIKDFFNF